MKGINPASLIAALNGDIHNAVVAAIPGGIEAQERAGQIASCAQSTLPKEMRGCTQADLESIGFVFGADQDELFVKVTMPTGWTKKAAEHAMYSDLLDDKGRVRGEIFYKAAFYDRRADFCMRSRFKVNSYISANADGQRDESKEFTHWLTVVEDCGKEIANFGVHKRSRDYQTGDENEKNAVAWLTERYPDWHSPMAYWNDDAFAPVPA